MSRGKVPTDLRQLEEKRRAQGEETEVVWPAEEVRGESGEEERREARGMRWADSEDDEGKEEEEQEIERGRQQAIARRRKRDRGGRKEREREREREREKTRDRARGVDV